MKKDQITKKVTRGKKKKQEKGWNVHAATHLHQRGPQRLEVCPSPPPFQSTQVE
jgi:hypothetical protein